MAYEWSFEEKMQHAIAIEIAKGAPDFGAYKGLFKASPMEIAAAILAIPAIAEALARADECPRLRVDDDDI